MMTMMTATTRVKMAMRNDEDGGGGDDDAEEEEGR